VPRINSPAELEELRNSILLKRDSNKLCIAVCIGIGCLARGATNVVIALEEEIKKQGLEAKVYTRETGCPGFCGKGPILVIYPEEICYLEVKPDDASEIVSQTIKEKRIVDRLLYTDPGNGEKIVHEFDIPFYKKQTRLLISNNIKIDPKNIDDYLALGGYSALAKALFQMTPGQVLEQVKKSNLRGRGGGGFPTGRKWETTRNAPGEVKHVIVNAHEGEPGAFMDRTLLMGNPHSVLEGLIIGAYAIGSHKGYIYTRHDTPLLVDNVSTALNQAKEYGLLGKNILGSGFNFSAELHLDIGIFVSGESSSLMTSIEGRAPEPRPKYIHTAESGIWERPSNLNNVETWANVPLIINRGSEWYASVGTERSKGTKLISLAGNIANPGVIEVPMGTSLKKVIYDIGGGIPGGKKFKAVHIGGPLGGSIPERLLNTPVDFDELAKVGAPLGAGGMTVMDENTCMVNMAKYFIDFLATESCGKCVPCREGLKQMRQILANIICGKGKGGDIKLLDEIAEVTRDASLCALGKGAANPVLSTLRYFRGDYEVHVKEKRCPVTEEARIMAGEG